MLTHQSKQDFVRVFEGLSISSSLDYLPHRIEGLVLPRDPQLNHASSASRQEDARKDEWQQQQQQQQEQQPAGRRGPQVVDELQEVQEENRRLVQELREKRSEVASLHELLWNSQVAPSQEELTALLLGSLVDSLSIQTERHEEEMVVELEEENQRLRRMLSEHGVTPTASPRKRMDGTGPADLKRQLIRCTKIIREQQRLLRQHEEREASRAEGLTRASSSSSSSMLAQVNSKLRLLVLIAVSRPVVMMLLKASVSHQVDMLQKSINKRDQLTSHQADIVMKEREIEGLKSTVAQQERTILWYRNKLMQHNIQALPPPHLRSFPPLAGSPSRVSRVEGVDAAESRSGSRGSRTEEQEVTETHSSARSSVGSLRWDSLPSGDWNSAKLAIRAQRESSSGGFVERTSGSRKLARIRKEIRSGVTQEAASSQVFTL
ncbi:hypothetical protein GUITHDRAFT_106671 [Guillardia theta CCMP2712]|uniref:Uncharacterized protein n=1 Tax=Guillardia theta (strain CCMP2712) TaxID=905079 RepID=L1JH71_GUITC|nr:hypothetical protein GUITHDRAFT_106671 [Guillardia theta CCMP2712]EKX47682.1 hypothetical protein GUITHDRAFT_106671 [Guillardia theta CCMP2712]|eukprot:XP_005834662.1 hypothetical protein GUITHDRAFT_106671 [Guillardia theta CCMP2712]